MRAATYPFSAIVGQEQMKLALLLAAVDWRISVLLRGDKGAGKTTTARALAALLPKAAPFVNLPIGATEDRLLGGLHLERTLKGDPVLKPGLLSEAHGGVLYVDEINLLAAHLGDALLDAASSGVNIVEREGLSAAHAAEFVLLGSMNPEEGTLRPQLLDRFALAVGIAAPLDAGERQTVVERRIAFERDAVGFYAEWAAREDDMREQIVEARARLRRVKCSSEILAMISGTVCEFGVRSLRADLAAVRASMAYAALLGDSSVEAHHVEMVMPLVLAHRAQDRGRTSPPAPPVPPSSSPKNGPGEGDGNEGFERVFAPRAMKAVAVVREGKDGAVRGVGGAGSGGSPGAVVGVRQIENPVELDVRATLNHALLETGGLQVRLSDLHERVRRPRVGTRYLFVVDSSGSHAAQERMRLVKGAAASLVEHSFRTGDEVAIIAFRGVAAEVILKPTGVAQDALTALEYLPTGGRTPLAHALVLAREFVTAGTALILLTDGRANVAMNGGEPWAEALEAARAIKAKVLVIDTEAAAVRLGHARKLAEAMGAEYVSMESLEMKDEIVGALRRLAVARRGADGSGLER